MSKLLTTSKGKRPRATAARRLKPVHPGEILLEEYMRPLKLSMNKLALGLRVPVTRISEIVRGERKITPETALRLGVYFKTTPDFWMNMQLHYDMTVAREKLLPTIEREVQRLG